MSTLNNFLNSVLGLAATEALGRVTADHPVLRAAVFPHTVEVWLAKASGDGWNGELPGIEGSYFLLAKSEVGFNGILKVSGANVSFQNVVLGEIVKSFSLVMDSQESRCDELLKSEKVNGVTVEKLHKSIERLVNSEWLKKFDLPGLAAGPRGPEKANAPNPQTKQTGVKPKVLQAPKPQDTLENMKGPQRGEPTVQKADKPADKKTPSIKMSRAEMEQTCLTCGDVEFDGEKFVGCHCYKELAKSGDFKLKPTKDGNFRFTFGASWEPDEVLAILGVVKRRKNG